MSLSIKNHGNFVIKITTTIFEINIDSLFFHSQFKQQNISKHQNYLMLC
jgi:hypothetical protein